MEFWVESRVIQNGNLSLVGPFYECDEALEWAKENRQEDEWKTRVYLHMNCPRCGKPDTMDYHTIQLDGDHRPIGKVYKCNICGATLAI